MLDEARLRYLFPRASRDFFDANRLRPADPQRAARPPLVNPLPGKTPGDDRIIVRYRTFRVRLLDQDNAFGATKTITDVLVQIGLLPSDDPQTIQVTVEQEKVRHYCEERTEITITY